MAGRERERERAAKWDALSDALVNFISRGVVCRVCRALLIASFLGEVATVSYKVSKKQPGDRQARNNAAALGHIACTRHLLFYSKSIAALETTCLSRAPTKRFTNRASSLHRVLQRVSERCYRSNKEEECVNRARVSPLTKRLLHLFWSTANLPHR